MKQKLLLLLAVVLGVISFALTATSIQNTKAKIAGKVKQIDVVALAKPIGEGETFTKEHLKRIRLSKGVKYIKNSREVPWDKRFTIIGSKAESSLDIDRVLTYYDLQSNTLRVRGLSGEIKPLARAKTIAVDAISSVNYMIKPKDKVDIIATFRFPEMRGNQSLDTITMTLLQNVTILATGSQRSSTESSSRRNYSTVTLQLTPEEVEMITFATQKGSLSLSLRNGEDARFEKETQSINFKYLQENINKYNKKREERAMDGTL